MKRILHIVGGMYPGGVENFIMNLYRNIDRDKVQFDMMVHKRGKGDFCSEIESMGGRVYLLPRKSRHPVKNLKMIESIVRENGYDLVIRHSANAYCVLDLKAAKKGGAKKTIFHSHSSSTKLKFIHKLFMPLMKTVPDYRFACSENAGKWMFDNLDFKIICNAVDIRKYAYDKLKAQQIRAKLGYNADDKIFIHVGNLRIPKNHIFMISFFEYIAKKDAKARLVLVGEGEERANIENKIKELNLESQVKLLGLRHDIADLLKMSDFFFLPSIYEGLPVSVIEAQAAGLGCLISDTITKDVIVTDLVSKMSLDEPLEKWADKALELVNSSSKEAREDTEKIYRKIAEAGYDIKTLAKFYEEL